MWRVVKSSSYFIWITICHFHNSTETNSIMNKLPPWSHMPCGWFSQTTTGWFFTCTVTLHNHILWFMLSILCITQPCILSPSIAVSFVSCFSYIHTMQALQEKWLLLVTLLVSTCDDTRTIYHCIVIPVPALCVVSNSKVFHVIYVFLMSP